MIGVIGRDDPVDEEASAAKASYFGRCGAFKVRVFGALDDNEERVCLAGALEFQRSAKESDMASRVVVTL